MFEREIKLGRIDGRMTFSQKVWALTARIPPGRVTTYGDIAAALGCRGARAVGQALHRNPYAPAVPCHRVVGADGSLMGFGGGIARKQRMLRGEGVPISNGRADLSRRIRLVLTSRDRQAAI